jgi:hypothetical protein
MTKSKTILTDEANRGRATYELSGARLFHSQREQIDSKDHYRHNILNHL